MFLLCLLVLCFILLVVDRWKPRKFVKLHQEVGLNLRYIPVIGHTLSFLGAVEDTTQIVLKITIQSFKTKHKAASAWIGNYFYFGVSDADQASAIMKSSLDKKLMPKFFKQLLGKGVIIAPVDIWHQRRKVLQSTFVPRNVSKFIPTFEAHSKITADLLESRVGKGEFSCLDYLHYSTLDSVCETLFGVNLDVQRRPDHSFILAFVALFQNIVSRVTQPWLYNDTIYKWLPIYAKHMRPIQEIWNFVDDLIDKKKSIMDRRVDNQEEIKKSENSKPAFKSFLELMIENSKNNDNAYSHEELREESVVLAIAGSDTSAVGASFTMLMLAHHQDIQDKVYREIQEVLGDPDKPLNSENLMKLKYTTAVIKETLRLYPPAPIIERQCKKAVELPSGLVVPDGCSAIISIWGIHRNPAHWGEDANEFNPDRFLKTPTPNAFFAFSHGSRNCVGQQYAMLFMTTILVTILRRFRLLPSTNSEYNKNKSLRVSFEITMKHVNNFLIQIEHRNNTQKC